MQVNTVSCHKIHPLFAYVFQPCGADETIIAEGEEKERLEVGKVKEEFSSR